MHPRIARAGRKVRVIPTMMKTDVQRYRHEAGPQLTRFAQWCENRRRMQLSRAITVSQRPMDSLTRTCVQSCHFLS